MTEDLDHWLNAVITEPATFRHRSLVAVDGILKPSDSGAASGNALPLRSREFTVCRGLPWLSEECSRRWLGNRLICFPQGIPSKRRISIASSRLQQRLDLEGWWFDLLRTATLKCVAETDALVVSRHSTAFAAASRAALIFGRQLISFDYASEPACTSLADLKTWLASCEQYRGVPEGSDGEPLHRSVFCSPEVLLQPRAGNGYVAGTSSASASESASTAEVDSGEGLDDLPLSDKMLFAAAQRVHVLACRPNGVVAKLVRHHLEDEERRTSAVLIAADESGRLPGCVSDLPSGWIPWLLTSCDSQSEDLQSQTSSDLAVTKEKSASGQCLAAPSVSGQSASEDRVPQSLQPPDVISHPEEWLLHWTRARIGPWPDESANDFLDALILRTDESNHSALAALLRIVSGQRLIASSEGIRGGYSVVAFTAVPLAEFRKRRVFRKHRHRFDFEPWGIAVRRTDLEQLGARPVIYGDADDWQSLASEDRPFFQRDVDSKSTNNSAEREWRLWSDLDLTRLSRSSVRIFVENADAARLIAQHGDWSVVVVPPPTS